MEQTLIQQAGYRQLNFFALNRPNIESVENGSLAEQIIFEWCKRQLENRCDDAGTKEGNDFIQTIFTLTETV